MQTDRVLDRQVSVIENGTEIEIESEIENGLEKENKIFWKSPKPICGYEYSLCYAQKEDIDLLSLEISAEEILEVWRLSHMKVEDVLHNAFILQKEKNFPIFSLYQKNSYEENIIAMGGLVPLSLGLTHEHNASSLIAEIWFLGTDMDKHSRFLIKYAKEILQEFLNTYPILINVVGAWNKRNIRWLRSLGFCVENTPQQIGVEKEFFHRFYITKDKI